MTVNGVNSFWTEENKAIAKKMYIDEDKSSSVVGNHLGVSRNAVIGVINRMGFKKENPTKKGIPRTKTGADRAKVYKRARTAAERVECRAQAPALTIIHGEDIHPLLGSVLELNDSRCAYPYGAKVFQFCGRKRTRGAFCDQHAALCYNDPLAYRHR